MKDMKISVWRELKVAKKLAVAVMLVAAILALTCCKEAEEPVEPARYAVGDKGPAGGTIVYVAERNQSSTYKDKDGNTVTYTWRYLEAAPEDVTIETTTTTGTTTTVSEFIFGYYFVKGQAKSVAMRNGSSDIGQGRLNTTMLINAMGENAHKTKEASSDTTSNYAAKVAYDYKCTNDEGEEFKDWFLPSVKEMEAVYEVLFPDTSGSASSSTSGTTSTTTETGWWTSTELSNEISAPFKNGDSGFGSRSKSYNVRPIRAFK